MDRTSVRRLWMTSIATAAAVGLVAAPASAHFCFKTDLNERAAQGMARSSNWVSFHDLVSEFTGLCDAGIDVLAEGAGAAPETLINGHGLMAAGTLKKGPDAGNRAISYLDFEGFEAALPDAIAACGG